MEPERIVVEDRTEYRLKGMLHREDGPAVIEKGGTERWYIKGEFHREDGPAVILKDGTELWYIHGKLHRENGPAIIDKDGPVIIDKDGHVIIDKDENRGWYINNKRLTEEEAETAKQILSGDYPFENLPLLINHPVLKYFALSKLGNYGGT